MPLFQPVGQIRLTNVAVVRLRSHGINFETACYANKICDWKSGKETDIDEVLQIKKVFRNVSKGQLAKREDIIKAFDGMDEIDICRIILEHGAAQVSGLERDTALDALLKDVSTIVSSRLANARTGLPLTPAMAESTLKEAGFAVKLGQPAKKLALKAIELLCQRHPDELVKTGMKIELRVPLTERERIRQFVVSECQGKIENEFNEVSQQERQYYTLVASVEPSCYRRLDECVNSMSPADSSLRWLASAESPGDEADEFAGDLGATPDAPSPLPPPQSWSRPSPNMATPGSGKVTQCLTCRIPLETAGHRGHYTTDWHKFNVKRKVKGLEPATLDEFNDMQIDLREQLIAVE
eukprot:GHVU01074716.1.p1 GENE.GHVU01074716.1~~GHVU01074716.1.p1  ORF type:complete len:353 (-),score=39.16 GHVU01074716.1:2483-3541(-)